MIDVPVRVKDALRDGRLKKKYRFLIGDAIYELVGQLTAGGEALFINRAEEYHASADGNVFFVIEATWYYPPPGGTEKTYYQSTYSNDKSVATIDMSSYTSDVPVSFEINYIDDESKTVVVEIGDPSDGFLIDNNNLVSESVKIDERACSNETIKFGLCEGSSLEFQYFGKDNIRDEKITAYIDVDYVKEDGTKGTYAIPMGIYYADSCSTQFSTGIKKVTAYNKLKSEYLDAKANSLIQDVQPDTFEGKLTLQTIQDVLLRDYQINPVQVISSVATRSETTASKYGPTAYFNNDSQQYFTYFETRSITFATSYVMRIELLIEPYIEKIKAIYDEFKTFVFANIQNPQTYWDKFANEVDNDMFHSVFGVLVLYYDGQTMQTHQASYTIDHLATDIDVEIAGFIDKLQFAYGVRLVQFYIPVAFKKRIYPSSTSVGGTVWTPTIEIDEDDVAINMLTTDTIQTIAISPEEFMSKDVTLRDLITANYELHCQFGRLDRISNYFSGVELNNSRLYPADNLYPANTLSPQGNSERGDKSFYKKLWTDSKVSEKFRKLYITYKGLDEDQKETDFVLERTVNQNGTQDYYMTDNWLFKNLVWTAANVGYYADLMVTKLQNVTWIPFEMWSAGLPYIETTDEIEISNNEGTFTSYVLQRTLTGIQNLQDTFINGTLDIF